MIETFLDCLDKRRIAAFENAVDNDLLRSLDLGQFGAQFALLASEVSLGTVLIFLERCYDDADKFGVLRQQLEKADDSGFAGNRRDAANRARRRGAGPNQLITDVVPHGLSMCGFAGAY